MNCGIESSHSFRSIGSASTGVDLASTGAESSMGFSTSCGQAVSGMPHRGSSVRRVRCIDTFRSGPGKASSSGVTSHDHEAAYSVIMRPPPVTL
jgi:hypothetical protein